MNAEKSRIVRATLAAISDSCSDTSIPTSGEQLISWTWNFGDGQTYYTSTGTYTISLTVCDPIICFTTTANITVSPSVATMSPVLSSDGSPSLSTQQITITLSSQIDQTALGGLTISDFATTNLTLSNLVVSSAGILPTDQQVYTVDATPITIGSTSIALPAGSVENLAGISNSASNVVAWVTAKISATFAAVDVVGAWRLVNRVSGYTGPAIRVFNTANPAKAQDIFFDVGTAASFQVGMLANNGNRNLDPWIESFVLDASTSQIIDPAIITTYLDEVKI